MAIDNIPRYVDRKSARFLRAVEYYGGTATLSEIRQQAGLSRDETNYRFKRLEELGLIEITYASEGYGDRTPPKVAHLTGVARREIERGLFSILNNNKSKKAITSNEEPKIRELQKRLNHCEHRLNVVCSSQRQSSQLQERVGELEIRLEDLESYTDELTEAVKVYLRALRAAFEDRGVEMSVYLHDVQQNWNNDDMD